MIDIQKLDEHEFVPPEHIFLMIANEEGEVVKVGFEDEIFWTTKQEHEKDPKYIRADLVSARLKAADALAEASGDAYIAFVGQKGASQWAGSAKERIVKKWHDALANYQQAVKKAETENA